MAGLWRNMALFAVGVLVVISIAEHQGTGSFLPGITLGNDHIDLFWLTFWATLLAGAIVTFGAGVALYLWQESNRRQDAIKDARQALEIAKEQLKYPLSLPEDWRGRADPSERSAVAPRMVIDSAAIIDAKPLGDWKELLKGLTDDARAVQTMIDFQTAYREYLTKETLAYRAFDVILEGDLGGDSPRRLDTVRSYLADALGKPEQEIALEYDRTVNGYIKGLIGADPAASAARDAFKNANEALWKKVRALKQEVGVA